MYKNIQRVEGTDIIVGNATIKWATEQRVHLRDKNLNIIPESHFYSDGWTLPGGSRTTDFFKAYFVCERMAQLMGDFDPHAVKRKPYAGLTIRMIEPENVAQ